MSWVYSSGLPIPALKYVSNVMSGVCWFPLEYFLSNSENFLIIGIGVNIVSNPEIKNNYQATNILLQTEKKPKIKEIIDLIISSYEKFFIELNSYDYVNFKKKAEVMALN